MSRGSKKFFKFAQAVLTGALLLTAGSHRVAAQSVATSCKIQDFDVNPAADVIVAFTLTRVTYTNVKGKILIMGLEVKHYQFLYSGEAGRLVQSYSVNGGPEMAVPGGDATAFTANVCLGFTGGQSASRHPPVGQAVAAAAAAATAGYAGQFAGAVAVADFNGDGNPDSAVLQGNNITINLYDAQSNLISSHLIPVANLNASIVTADFNGDGKFDLAVAVDPPSGPGSVAVLLGNGDGTFGAPSTFAAGPFPFYLAVSDFNKDGKADLAVSNYPVTPSANGTVAVLLGDGRGGFAPAVMYTVGKGATTIVADDFTGDGNPDIVALDQGLAANSVWTLPGNGDGTFKTAVSTPVPLASGYLSYTDFDHDGYYDLLIADQESSTMALMLGKGDGTFKAAQRFTSSAQALSVGLIPLQDGSTAILTPDNIGNDMAIYFSSPTGVMYAPAVQTFGKLPVAIAAGDLNGDGKPDLIIADSSGRSLYTELSQGTGGFSAPQAVPLSAAPAAIALADLNHDGYADAIVASSNGLQVLKSSASGALSAPQVFGAGENFVSVTMADFNGDGKPDAAAAASDGTVQVFIGNGDATFRSPTQITLPSGPVPLNVVSADVNKDGKPDLIVVLRSADYVSPASIAVALGNGDGTPPHCKSH